MGVELPVLRKGLFLNLIALTTYYIQTATVASTKRGTTLVNEQGISISYCNKQTIMLYNIQSFYFINKKRQVVQSVLFLREDRFPNRWRH